MTGFRPIDGDDGQAVFDVFYEAIADVDRRLGDPSAWDPTDGAMRADAWAGWRSLFEHVAATSDLGWLAEEQGEVVGYARSILRGHSRELTEFFVKPRWQAGGLGRELLARAFPAEPGVDRSIVATLEIPALARYLALGLGIRTMIGRFGREPLLGAADDIDPGLQAVPMTAAADEIDGIAALDLAALGNRRDEDHAWLRSVRDGVTYWRGRRLVGYGYVGRGSEPFPDRCGPVLAADPLDLRSLLADIEVRAARRQLAEVSFWVPLSNSSATGHLLARRYRLDNFLAALFADGPLPGLDRYVITSPPFFL